MRIVKPAENGMPPEIIDPGLVGEVTGVDPKIIHTLTGQGFIPVIAPVGVGEAGETYNINADLVAGRIAMALNAGRLILITDVDGVKGVDDQLISSIDRATARQMIAEGSITGGMIPKVECALTALAGGVEKVPIINGRRRHAILLELFTDSGIGTEVTL
jgi:acetylglutamate kinase